MKATDFFRAIDDSDLDTYEIRYLIRVWRRGTCWEKLTKTAETTKGLSIGKASQVRRDLLEKGWLVMTEADGRMAYQVAIPDVVAVHEVKSIVAEFHDVKPEFHDMKQNFHGVHALPINKQNEDHNYKSSVDTPSLDDERDEKQRAWNAIVELIEFWERLTRRRRPADGTEDLRDRWIKPFNEIWIICGRDVEAAKAKIQAVRDGMLSRGGSIFDPAKLPAHVQAISDAEMLPMTQRMNGYRQPAAPLIVMKEIAPGLF